MANNFGTLFGSDPSGAGNFGRAMYSGVFTGGSGGNYWSTTSHSKGDFTLSGTVSLTQLQNVGTSGFGTVSAAASSLPGITFTAPATGYVRVTSVLYGGTDATTGNSIAYFLTDGSGTVVAESSGTTTTGSVQIGFCPTLIGYYSVTSGSSYTFKIMGATPNGTNYIYSPDFGYLLSFHVEYVG